jgi:hypothetical protein
LSNPVYLAGAVFAFRTVLFAVLFAVAAYRLARPLVAGKPESMRPMVRRARVQLLIGALGLAAQVPLLLAPPESVSVSTVLLCALFTAVVLNGLDQLGGRR